MNHPATPGGLVLVPTPLDFGVGESTELQEVLPLGVIRQAAALTHWVAENARSARACSMPSARNAMTPCNR